LKTDEAALELRRQDVVLSKADLESAKINLSIAEQRLQDTKVYAPIDGVVTARFVQSGQIISSGISTTGGGTPIMTLSDLSRLYVLASVDESDIGDVRPGQKVQITADAYPGMSFGGVIERVAQKGVNTSNVVTFEVRIEILGENKSLLKPEMTANVDIIIAEKEKALTLPVAAVSRVKGIHTVSVLRPDGSTEAREVDVGISDGMRIEIVSGLDENETVLVNEGAAFSEWRREGGPPGGAGPARMMGGFGRR
jgi:HlyD family secretion protein